MLESLYFWIVVLLRVPCTARRSNQSILKEINPEHSLEGLMLKLKLPILWPPDEKNWLIGQDSDVGKDWKQEEKGMTEDEMAGWHHRLDGREFEWTPGVRDGQGGLACCNSWGHKESDTTEQLNWTEHIWSVYSSYDKDNKRCLSLLKIHSQDKKTGKQTVAMHTTQCFSERNSPCFTPHWEVIRLEI